MLVTTAEISSWVGSFVWPFIRVSAVLIAAPMFSGRSVSARIRVILAFVVTWMLMPLLPPVPPIQALGLETVLIAMHEIIVGVAIGFSLQLVFQALIIAGEQIALSMGLGFASMVDPQNGVNVPVLSQFLSLFGMLLFLSIDGHILLLDLVAKSFHTLPVGTFEWQFERWRDIAYWGSEMFTAGLWIALPIVAIVKLIYLSLGVMTRAAPQLNIFAVGFPLTMMAGFVSLNFAFPTVVHQFLQTLQHGFRLAQSTIGG